jgi:hypothetical protein
MSTKKLIAGAATLAVLAGGSVAVAANTTTDRKAEEQALLADAAKRLGVTDDQLRSALTAAEDARLAAAVKAGTLTQDQADTIKARRAADGTVLSLGRGGPGGRGGRHFLLEDAAKAIGITQASLKTQLREGKTLTQIAQAKDKTLAEVKAAVKKTAIARLDADLKASKLTKTQYDHAVERLDDQLEHLGDARFGGRGGGPRRENPAGSGTPSPTP